MSSDPKELAICANILSQNPKLFPFDSFETMFIDAGARIAHKEVFVKRLAGLVSSMAIATDIDSNYPELKNT